MNFNLIIRCVFLFYFGQQLSAQNDSAKDTIASSTLKFLFDESRQYLGSVSLAYQMATTYGDGFMGSGFEGKGGFHFNANVYVIKNFFLGINFTSNRFNITNQELIGNYSNTQISERYISLGYEFLPVSKVRLGVHTSVIGTTSFSNDINNDTGSFWNYGLRLEYEVIKNLNVFLAYDWRTINTDIRVPSQLETFFEKGQYKVLSFGIKFNFGRYDFIDAIVL